jgi:hypothetical protein
MPDIADKMSYALLVFFAIGHHENEGENEPSRFISTNAEKLASYIRAVIASDQATRPVTR